MCILLARSVSRKSRRVALLSAASAVAMVVGAAAPQQARATDWYWTGASQDGVLNFFDPSFWADSQGRSLTVMPTDGFAFHFSADASFTGKSVWIETGTVTFVNHHANDTVNFGEQVDFTIGAGASVLFKGPGNFSSASNFRNWQGQVIVDESLFNFTTDVGAGSLVTIKVQNGGSLDLGGHKASNFSYELNNGTLKDGRLGARMPTTVKSKGGTIDGVVSVQDATDLTAVIAESGTTNLTGTSTFGAVTVKDTSTLTLYTDVGQTLKLKTLTVDAGGTLIIGANGKGATVQSDNDGSTVLNVSLGGTVKFDAAQGVNLTDNNLKFGDKANDKGSLVKTGAGGLVLSTQHSYTGDTTIESGTLVLGSDDVLARSSKVTVGNGATFDLGTKSQTTDQLILDSGTLKNGAFKGAISSKSGTIADLTANSLAELTAETGTTTLNGANVFKSILVKDGATLLSNDPTKTTTVNDNVTFEANSTYKVAITKDNFLTSLDIKSGSLKIDGGAKLIVEPRGDGFAIGQTYIIAKTSGGINRAFANDNVTLLTLVNMKATTTLVNGNKDLQVNLVSNVAQAQVPQTVDLYWVGGNTGDAFALSNWKKDSYQGASLNSMGAPVASINFNKDATVTGDLPNAATLTVNIDTGKTVTLTGVLMNQDATTKSSLTVTSGTLIIANQNAANGADKTRILSGAITIRHNATLQLGNTDPNFNITLGVINSSQFLNDGTLTIVKPRDVDGNSYNFSVWDQGEILRSANATGTDGKFVIRGGVALKLTDAFKINQDMVVITARNDANNQKKFSILELGDLTTAPVVRAFAVGGILRFNNANDQSITTIISDWTTFSGDVVKLGAGQLNLTGAHTYTGTTRVEGGTLKLMTADAITNSSDVSVLQNGTLDMNNLTQSFKALQVSGGTLRNGVVTITGGNSNAIISNGGTFTNVKGGANLQVNGGPDAQHIYKTTLNGTNTFGALTIAANAELLIVQRGVRENLFKSVTINEGGVLRMGDGNTENSNIGNADSASQTVAGQITPLTIKNGGTVYVKYGPREDYGADDLGAVIEDLDATHKGRLVKEGIGYFLLKRQHSYTGDTVITGGSLVLATNNALHRSSKLIITNGTFRLDGKTQTSDLVELGAGGVISNGNAQGSTLIGRIDATGGRVTGIIGGATLNVNANTVDVTGANTFGAITIKNAAILRVTGNTTDTSVTIEAGGKLQLGDGTTNGSVKRSAKTVPRHSRAACLI
jgi:fibronectin-binding autotransporter adhesin